MDLSLLYCFGCFVFFLSQLLAFSQISHCKKTESRIINLHVCGNDGGGSLFSLILIEFKICLENQPFGEKVPGCLFCGVFLPIKKAETRRKRFCVLQLAANRLDTCSPVCIQHAHCIAVWIISHVFLCLCIFEFCRGMSNLTKNFYRMLIYQLAFVTSTSKERNHK